MASKAIKKTRKPPVKPSRQPMALPEDDEALSCRLAGGAPACIRSASRPGCEAWRNGTLSETREACPRECRRGESRTIRDLLASLDTDTALDDNNGLIVVSDQAVSVACCDPRDGMLERSHRRLVLCFRNSSLTQTPRR